MHSWGSEHEYEPECQNARAHLWQGARGTYRSCSGVCSRAPASGRANPSDLGNLYLDGNRQKRVTRSAAGAASRVPWASGLAIRHHPREEAQRNQTPSSRAGGVISQLLSQDSRVVTVYSVHCVQCVLSTSATASSPNALATIPTPSATNRPVRSVQDGRTYPLSYITCVGHGLIEKRCRGRR